jgi:hypothetical protein
MESTSVAGIVHQPSLSPRHRLRAIVKQVIGERATRAVRRRVHPLRLRPLEASMRRFGWSLRALRMTDEQARAHFANDVDVDEFGRAAIRFFHEFKVEFLLRLLPRQEIGASTFLEIGDSDGLVLQALGKRGFSINNDPRCIDLMARNGIEAIVAHGESLRLPDKSYDIVMAFETLEHSLNPVAFLAEMARLARRRVILSVPGVSRTIVHPRLKGSRVGEEHVFEFCSRDLLRLATHLPLRPVTQDVLEMFAPPASPVAWLYYTVGRGRDLFCGCFRRFDFYVFDVVEADHGIPPARREEVY